MDHKSQISNTKRISQTIQERVQRIETNPDINVNKINQKQQILRLNSVVKEKNINQNDCYNQKQIKSYKTSFNIIDDKCLVTGSEENSNKNYTESLSQQNSKLCENILQLLNNHILSLAFRLPVDPYSEGIPDYYQVVKRPMDLQTIRLKLNRGRYVKVNEFYKDIELIITNSLFYNRKNQQFIQVTHQFQKYFRKIQKLYGAKNSKNIPIKPKVVKKTVNQKQINAIEKNIKQFKASLLSAIIQQKNLYQKESFILNKLPEKENIFIDKQTQQISCDSSKIVNESSSQLFFTDTNIEDYFSM